MLCAVSMAVDRGGEGGDAQPGGWRWLTCSAAGSLGIEEAAGSPFRFSLVPGALVTVFMSLSSV